MSLCCKCLNLLDKKDHYGLHDLCFEKWFQCPPTSEFEGLTPQNIGSGEESDARSSFFHGKFKKYTANDMKNSSKISKILVFNENQRGRVFVGELIRTHGKYIFSYDLQYMSRASATPLGPDLPFSLQEIRSKDFFESLHDLIPSRANPAYEQYCHSVGISPEERDPMARLAYLGKGPSNFVFEPAPKDNTPSGKETLAFREALGLSQKQFANLLDIPVPTLQTLEKETAEASTTRRLIQIFIENPTSLWKVLKRRGVYLHSRQLRRVEEFIREKEQALGTEIFEKQKKYRELGYLEVYHSLTSSQGLWDQSELLAAAEKSRGKPTFKKDGLEATMEYPDGNYDEWYLKRSGDYYFFRIFEEDQKTKPQRSDVLYFNTRIGRIAEVIIHCENIYNSLGVDPAQSIELEITHSGLEGRKLSASDPLRVNSFSERRCHEKEIKWARQATLMDLKNKRLHYISKIAGELFILFDGWKPGDGIIEGVYQEFLKKWLNH